MKKLHFINPKDPAIKRRARIRVIKSGPLDNVTISLEDGWSKNKSFPVLLFIPDMERLDHWHIELHKKEATRLRDYLDRWLKEKK